MKCYIYSSIISLACHTAILDSPFGLLNSTPIPPQIQLHKGQCAAQVSLPPIQLYQMENVTQGPHPQSRHSELVNVSAECIPVPVVSPGVSRQTDDVNTPKKKNKPTAPTPYLSSPTTTGVHTQAKVTALISPQYPNYCRRRKQSGSATIRVSVNRQGQCQYVTCIISSGYPRLDQAAIEAARQAQYAPALVNDTPVASELELVFVFRLDGT